MAKHIIVVFVFLAIVVQAQKPAMPIVKPTPVEFLFGNNRIQGQNVIVKDFPNSKFGIFSLLTLAGDYQNTDKTNNELFSNIQLNYDIYKGLKISSGVTFSSAKGFAPIAGLEYVFVNKNITFVINPTIDLRKSSSFATYSHLEYSPKNDKLNLYARLQGLFVQHLGDGLHERSAAVIRCGITYKGFATGLGLNQDYYGPVKIQKSNVGLFLSYKFI